jgi:hypothetical protein
LHFKPKFQKFWFILAARKVTDYTETIALGWDALKLKMVFLHGTPGAREQKGSGSVT